MKVGKINPDDFQVTKTVRITVPVEVEVRGNNQILSLKVGGKNAEAFRGMCSLLMKAQEEYEKAAF